MSPRLGSQCLTAVRGLSRIQQGRIALLFVWPTGLLTYDALKYWRYELSNTAPTAAAGQSAFIFTVLPSGTFYESDSFIFEQVL